MIFRGMGPYLQSVGRQGHFRWAWPDWHALRVSIVTWRFVIGRVQGRTDAVPDIPRYADRLAIASLSWIELQGSVCSQRTHA